MALKKNKSKKIKDKSISKLNKTNISFEKQGIGVNRNSYASLINPPIIQESIDSSFGVDDLVW